MTQYQANNHLQNTLLHEILLNMPMMMNAYDSEGYFSMWNRECELVTGYSAEEVIGNPNIIEMFYPDKDYREKMMAEWAMRGNDFRDWEIDITCKDGSVKTISWFNISEKTPIPGWAFWAMGVDVTKRKQAEEQLRQTASELEKIFEALPDLYFVVNADSVIVNWQVGCVDSLYVRPENFLGKTFAQVLPEPVGKQMEEAIHQVREKKTLVMCEYSLAIKDSISFYEARILPLLDDKVIIVVRNITEKKLVEQALWEERKFIEKILDTVNALIVVLDLEGRIVRFNRACEQATGYSFEEVRGQSFCELFLASDNMVEECSVKDSLSGIVPHQFEKHWKTKNGGDRLISWSHSAILDNTGEGKYIIVTGIDITDRNRTEELLRKSDKLAAIGELAAGVAHEVRNPLTVLKGFLQVLQARKDDTEKHLQVMLSEVDRIESIINEFLALAKPEVKNFEKKRLQTLLFAIVDLIHTKAMMGNIQITLESDVESDLLFIECDENQIKQVFINILQNAIEAMPHGGEITISAKRFGQDMIMIRIADQGCGIPKERIHKLGEPFYSTKEKGTGLGLMISYKIIENHKGRIQIQSEVGRGTSVDLYLPVKQ